MSLALPLAEKNANAVSDVIALRPATTQDAASVAAIYNASLRTQPYQPDGVSETDAARWLAEELAKVKDKDAVRHTNYVGPMSVPMAKLQIELHQFHRRPMMVATQRGETLGWLGSLGLHDRPGLGGLFELAYYVAPRWRGRGVGTRLIKYLVTNAATWRVDRLMAMVWSDNAASLSVLRRAGFSTWGELPGAVTAFGKRRDMVLLGMTLEDIAHEPDDDRELAIADATVAPLMADPPESAVAAHTTDAAAT
ncbi:N-acetyltransferase family protein [Roseateles chitinivorans]|uniref:GNAT family N-acetyltransferase n=1 Tax=Roseateles chitinivorans TaxID=2917965 RepID=UPI003D667315